MKPGILVTRHVYPEAIAILERHGEVEYHDSAAGLTTAALAAAAPGKRALVCQLGDRIDASVIARGTALKVIANVAVGFDNIDVAAATERGIVVTNTPDVLTDTTADLTFALMLAAARRLGEAERMLRAGRWRRWEIDLLCGHDVHHGTLGILGLGRIGSAVARRARGFDMRVLYHGPTRADPAREHEAGAEYVDRKTLYRESDFVSIHVPLTADTRRLVGAAEFALMKRTAILVNTSRGPVVDEAALALALDRGLIAGAGLDVFEAEPEVDPRLLALENVVLVPHIGSASIRTRARMCTLAAENAVAVLEGRRPPHPVNPEALGA